MPQKCVSFGLGLISLLFFGSWQLPQVLQHFHFHFHSQHLNNVFTQHLLFAVCSHLIFYFECFPANFAIAICEFLSVVRFSWFLWFPFVDNVWGWWNNLAELKLNARWKFSGIEVGLQHDWVQVKIPLVDRTPAALAIKLADSLKMSI